MANKSSNEKTKGRNHTEEAAKNKREIGQRIKKIREKVFRENQANFAKRLEVPQSHVSNIENGTTHPSIPLLKKVIRVSNVRWDWLMAGSGEMLEVKNLNSEKIAVNHKVLLWAREALALSRNMAAEKTGLAPTRLAQLEQGKKQPDIEELKKMAKAYKRSLATLMLYEPPEEKPLPKDMRTIDSKHLNEFHEKTIIAVRRARALVQSLLELRNEMGVPIVPFSLEASIDDSPKEVSLKFRKVWNLEEFRSIENINDALEVYIERVESLGVAVFQLPLTEDNLRGFSLIDEPIPVIAIKRGSEPPHSKIFTLFHELGHILLHSGGLCDIQLSQEAQDIEKWCNAFAGELLIPSTELIQKPVVQEHAAANNKIWQKKELVELGQQFHVGPLAVLRSLKELNRTTKDFYKKKHEQWNKPALGRGGGGGRKIAEEAVKEKGRSFVILAFNAFDQNKIDLKDLSDYLGVKLSYIPKTRELLSM